MTCWRASPSSGSIRAAAEGGVAQQLVAGAMADVAQRGETVIPHCPVVSGYLRKNEVPGLDIIWPTHPHPE